MKYIVFLNQYDIDKFDDASEVHTIPVTQAEPITFDEAVKLCSEMEKNIVLFEQMKQLMQEGDRLFEITTRDSGCIQRRSWFGIKLKRENKTIDFFKLTPSIQQKSNTPKKDSEIAVSCPKWYERIFKYFK